MHSKTTGQEHSPRANYSSSVYPGLGITFGFFLGLLIDNLGMGLSLGLCIGGLVNAVREYSQGREGSKPAIAIYVLGLAVAIGIWIWIG